MYLKLTRSLSSLINEFWSFHNYLPIPLIARFEFSRLITYKIYRTITRVARRSNTQPIHILESATENLN